MKYINKNLIIEKVSVQNIAKKFGTPAYCYSYNQLKKNIYNFKQSFKSFSPLICFAIKSNTNLNLIKEIKKFGLGAEVPVSAATPKGFSFRLSKLFLNLFLSLLNISI